MYNKGLKIINKKVKEKWQIAQKVIKGILIHWFISIEPGTNVKKIVNWPCDKLNSASLFIILLVGQEVEIWMSTWSFRPAAYIEWMVAVLMTKRYEWNGLNLVVLETLVLKAPWRKLSPSFSFSIMTFLNITVIEPVCIKRTLLSNLKQWTIQNRKGANSNIIFSLLACC